MYDLNDLVGKSVFVNRDVILTRLPEDGAPAAYTVKKGGNVGTLYSWLDPKEGRKNTWLMFYDNNGRAYYMEIVPGSNAVNTSAFTSQGVDTVEQKQEDAKPWTEKIPTYLFRGALLVGAFYVLGKAVEGKKLF